MSPDHLKTVLRWRLAEEAMGASSWVTEEMVAHFGGGAASAGQLAGLADAAARAPKRLHPEARLRLLHDFLYSRIKRSEAGRQFWQALAAKVFGSKVAVTMATEKPDKSWEITATVVGSQSRHTGEAGLMDLAARLLAEAAKTAQVDPLPLGQLPQLRADLAALYIQTLVTHAQVAWAKNDTEEASHD